MASCACVASYLLRDADVETTTRAELRREHPDAAADDIELERSRLAPSREQIFLRDPDIDLGVERHAASFAHILFEKPRNNARRGPNADATTPTRPTSSF